MSLYIMHYPACGGGVPTNYPVPNLTVVRIKCDHLLTVWLHLNRACNINCLHILFNIIVSTSTELEIQSSPVWTHLPK